MKMVLFFLLIAVTVSTAQEKHFIYFKDKKIPSNQILMKGDAHFNAAEILLTERSIERRKKTMGDNYITFEDLPVNEEYVNELLNLGVEIIWQLNWFNCVSAYMYEKQVDDVSKLWFVERIEPVKSLAFKKDFEEQTLLIPDKKQSVFGNDYGPSFNQLQLSRIPEVHAYGIKGDGVMIGFLDTGYRWRTHESLMNSKVIAEYDFIFGDTITANQPEDHPSQDFHGTLVFSVTGGYAPGQLIGASYRSSFLLAKTEDIRSERNIEEDNYAAALIWMESLGVDITTSSLGYSEFDQGQRSYTYSEMNGNTTIVTKAANLAYERGIVTITSAGNEGNSSWRFITAPADAYNILAVGSVNANNELSGFSSRGPTSDGRIKPEIVARGEVVLGALATDSVGYRHGSGTSLSAPIAAGVAGLLLSAHPHLNNKQVRSILMETSDNSSSPNNDRGYGLVSAVSAISYPTIEKIDNKYFLHKYFLNNPGIDLSTVKMLYSTDGENFTQLDYHSAVNKKFKYEFPSMGYDQIVQFYFSYLDSSSVERKEPVSGSYKFQFGQLTVYHNLDLKFIPTDYVLSQNYPNPFNSGTKINVITETDENVQLIIFNALGQKVKTLFSGLMPAGLNTLPWDGRTDSGTPAASGVYYYILRMAGKEFAKKMLLLR